MTTFANLKLAIDQLATYAKANNTNQGALSNLNTTAQASLVAAINEVKAAADAAAAAAGSTIDDAVTNAENAWSSSKIQNELTAVAAAANQAIIDLINGAPTTADTLIELNGLISDNETIITTLTNGQAKRVAVDVDQTFTAAETLRASQNMGLGDNAIDFNASVTAILTAP